MAAPGSVDPSKPGKYPIILSDALLGKPSKETYTGVRYNHRPALSSDTAPSQARLKKSPKDGSYNLAFEDNGDKYQYNGARTTDDNNFVLIFDPARKAFVLHRVDSTFHMNLTKTPTDGSVESLRKQFPQLEVKTNENKIDRTKETTEEKATPIKKPVAAKGKTAKETKVAGSAKRAATTAKGKATKAATEKTTPMTLTLPTAPAPSLPVPAPAKEEKKTNRRAASPVESDEDDDDDPFQVEFPGGPAPPKVWGPATHNFSPAFGQVAQADEDEDADGEFDYEADDDAPVYTTYKPPSPVKEPDRFTFESAADSDRDAEGEVVDAGDDIDVEQMAAEMEMELFGQSNDQDSEESEEE